MMRETFLMGGTGGLPTRDAGNDLARGLAFVRRVYLLRVLGLGLGFFCVASVLHLNGAHSGSWMLLGAYAFLWPHVAKAIGTRDADPRRAELRNLMIDSAMGGVWIAVMQFNLLPTVLLVTMLSLDKISVGGAPLLARTTLVLVATCAITSALLGFPVQMTTPMPVIIAGLPLLVAYPLAISGVTHSLRMHVARQNRRLEELGRTDGLTGLANRRKCLDIAEVELERFRRTGRPAVLMVLDVDNFKGINDRYGHPVGDEVLCAIAVILRVCCRAVDMPSRFGGDEFLIVLPETDIRRAETIARRIRDRLRAIAIERAPDLLCTASMGAAETSRHMGNADAWLQGADAALYDAKAAGRDRFVGVPLA